jgi:multidrug efflux pump
MIITDYSIKFRIAAFVLIAVIMVIGGSSYMTLPREGPPDITIPLIFVTSLYEGVAPAEMESLVTIPLEKEFRDLPNVKEITSSSSEGVSAVVIEFTPEQDIDDALQKVKDKIDLARPDLPTDLDEPMVQDINVSTDVPVLIFTLSGHTSLERLKSIAEGLEDEIETIPGVLQATIFGTHEREIRVEVDLERLMAYGLPMSAVSAALVSENATLSAGNVDTAAGEKFQVRVPGEFASVTEMKTLILAVRNGQPIYLSDVAEVLDTHKDISSVSRINGEACVSVMVQKRTGQNTVAIADAARELLGAQDFPPGVSMTVTTDQSKEVRMMLAELENNVASGFILVVAVLVIAMGFRNSLLVGLAIPFSMLISFTVLQLIGYTLNMIVLFSLVLALGMLVDNAIVIVENIFRHHSEGASRIDAARRGASEVAWPVITSTLTTCAAFSPLMFCPGIMGEFMGYLPKTLICTLTASLFVAIVLNPAVCSVIIRKKKVGVETKTQARGRAILDAYEGFLRLMLRRRMLVLVLSFVVFVLTIQVFKKWGQGVELFPDVDPPSLTVQVRYPEGTGIAKTDATLATIEERLVDYPDIEFMVSNAGSLGGGMGASEVGTHVGSITVRFFDFEDRTTSTRATLSRIRDDMPPFPGAEIMVEREEMGPPTGAPVSIEVSGDDFGVLSELAREVQRRVRGIEGLVDLRDDVEDSRPELRFNIDRQRAALLGVNTRMIGGFLRSAVNGMTVSKYRAGEEEYDITVRLPADQRDTALLFEQLSVMSAHGRLVPLSSIGTVEYAGGRGAIKRKDHHRTISIIGNNQDRGVDKILADAKAALADMEVPKGYTIAYTGDNEDMQESGEFLTRSFGLALALIAVVLVIQFNSVLLPGIIMVSVALSLIGVMWGLLICRMKFGVIMTGVGVISLAGVVVNNAIVLIDCISHRQRAGLSVTDAVVAGGRLRLRPVLLTAVTTILGLIPMAIGFSLEIHSFPPHIVTGSETSAWWAPMAIAVIFGLAVATILTLVLVPIMYSLSESLVKQLRWYFRLTPETD